MKGYCTCGTEIDEVQFTQFGKCEKCYMEDEEKNRKQREYYNKNLVKSREKKREYYHQNKKKIRKGKNMSMRKTYAKMNQEEKKGGK